MSAAAHFLARDRRANVAMLFALMLPVILGCFGAALDYSNIRRIQSRLNAIADAASLHAVSPGSIAYQEALKQQQDGEIEAAEADTVAWLRTEVGSSTPGVTLSSVIATVNRKDWAVSARVSYTAVVPSYVLKIFHFSEFTFSGTASAANGLPAFIDFYLLLDNSPSMGLGATPSDIATMVAKTPDQCAFACHDLSDPNNYYNLAKSLGVTMRIDVLREATKKLMTTAPTAESVPNQYRAAIYTFNENVSTISSLTSDFDAAATAAAKIDLVAVPYQNYHKDEFTDYAEALTYINGVIDAPGDGQTQEGAQKVLFFVSDGVNDSAGNKGNGLGKRTISPISLSLCDAIKSRGIKIAVLYTTYLPLPTNAFYNSNIAPWASTIGPKMESCASPGLYFEVSPSQGISEAMQALFERSIQQARITQ